MILASLNGKVQGARVHLPPGAPLTNFNDGVGGRGGGSDRGSYFIPQKITTLEFVYPKKSLLFLAYPKKIP